MNHEEDLRSDESGKKQNNLPRDLQSWSMQSGFS